MTSSTTTIGNAILTRNGEGSYLVDIPEYKIQFRATRQNSDSEWVLSKFRLDGFNLTSIMDKPGAPPKLNHVTLIDRLADLESPRREIEQRITRLQRELAAAQAELNNL